MQVVVDQQWYRCGDTLSGVARLDIKKAEGYPCDHLNLRIGGAESTCVRYTTHTGTGKNRRSHTHYARDSRAIISIDAPIATFSGGILPQGQHEFPFTAVLPQNLPSKSLANNTFRKTFFIFPLTQVTGDSIAH